MHYARLVFFGVMAFSTLAVGLAMAKRPNQPSERERFDKLFAEGNYKDAYDGYRRLALDAKTEPARVGTDLKQAVRCLTSLGRMDEMDSFVEAVVAIHPANWRLLQAAAETYFLPNEHWGAIVAGQFHRGERANGRVAGSYERDRGRAIQLLIAGLNIAGSDPDRGAVGQYFHFLAQVFLGNRAQIESWRLQSLTSFDVLPDYDANPSWYYGASGSGAPVEPDGTPVYYRVPESLQKASNDGQRWRWALIQAAEADPKLLNATRADLAGFLLFQFGTQTLIGHDVPSSPEEGGAEATGPYALDTLKDDETIAWLASGIKRFKLPDEFNPIKIYQALFDDRKTGQGEVALDSLASIFENRRQFDRAADYLKTSRDLYGDKDEIKKRQIDQILGAWGEFDRLAILPAGNGANVDFRFRNGKLVHFEAQEVLFTKLLNDVKDYMTSGPKQLDWQKFDLSDIGARLVVMNQEQYVGRSVARWDLDLEPRPAISTGESPSRCPSRRPAPISSPRRWREGTFAASSSGSTTR